MRDDLDERGLGGGVIASSVPSSCEGDYLDVKAFHIVIF